GKSLYKNAHDGSSVYTVSTLRPNTALQYKSQENIHDVNVEANIFNWLQQHEGADLYPDFVLEQAPELLQKYKVVVLAYHVEYVSGKMYKNLRRLVNKQKLSLISLGANQIYWKVEWHDDFTRMECRKDASNFSKSGRTGGMWRHTSEPEAKLLGVCFTDAGRGTYAPYQVLQPNHWLYKDTQIQKGDLFGLSGINQIPVCGDETDKINFCSDSAVTVLAKGLNKKSVSEFEVYKQNDPEWNGAGGGCLVLKELSKKQAVLSTGSIQSGAGLGADAVFTKIVENFLERYA
ncbi:MAG: hypothetical protein LPK21_00265, partial [Hymenobacteraceae bacterium]|nr:hypothetical protein [Hymenobacteraceae bacterium]MDX5510638.1 hypothetical protein [Hymenobacteraceae bacterium]